MMNRRGFLGVLSGLPFAGLLGIKAKPKPELMIWRISVNGRPPVFFSEPELTDDEIMRIVSASPFKVTVQRGQQTS